jgi:hypothetical protein
MSEQPTLALAFPARPVLPALGAQAQVGPRRDQGWREPPARPGSATRARVPRRQVHRPGIGLAAQGPGQAGRATLTGYSWRNLYDERATLEDR